MQTHKTLLVGLALLLSLSAPALAGTSEADLVRAHSAGAGVLDASSPLVTDASVDRAELAVLSASADWRVASQAMAVLAWRDAPDVSSRAVVAQPAPTRSDSLRFVAPVDDVAVAAVMVQRLLYGDEDAPTRHALARVLAVHSDDMAVVWLGALAHDASPIVREALVLGLRTADRSVAERGLALALADAEPEVRAAALAHIVRHPDAADFAETYLNVLGDPAASVRVRACKALGWHGVQQGYAPMVALLQDADADVRLAALMALKRLDRPRTVALPVVRSLSADADERVSRVAGSLLD